MNLTAEEWLKIKGYLLELSRYHEYFARSSEKEDFQKYMLNEANEIKGFLESISK